MEAICQGECGKFRKVHKNKRTGKLLCPVCCRRDPAASEYDDCHKCKEFKFVAGRTEEDEPLCLKCIREETTFVAVCEKCGLEKIIQAVGLCYGCYKARSRARKSRLERLAKTA